MNLWKIARSGTGAAWRVRSTILTRPCPNPQPFPKTATPAGKMHSIPCKLAMAEEKIQCPSNEIREV